MFNNLSSFFVTCSCFIFIHVSWLLFYFLSMCYLGQLLLISLQNVMVVVCFLSFASHGFLFHLINLRPVVACLFVLDLVLCFWICLPELDVLPGFDSCLPHLQLSLQFGQNQTSSLRHRCLGPSLVIMFTCTSAVTHSDALIHFFLSLDQEWE